jgi:hypothetical protein
MLAASKTGPEKYFLRESGQSTAVVGIRATDGDQLELRGAFQRLEQPVQVEVARRHRHAKPRRSRAGKADKGEEPRLAGKPAVLIISHALSQVAKLRASDGEVGEGERRELLGGAGEADTLGEVEPRIDELPAGNLSGCRHTARAALIV